VDLGVFAGLSRHPNTGKSVFVGSMTDIFHTFSPFYKDLDILSRMLTLMRSKSHHQFLMLTKHPINMALTMKRIIVKEGGLPPNLWLGVTICHENELTRNLTALLEIEGARRYVSFEPLLSPIVPFLQPRWLAGLDGVIVGGETGPGARPMHPVWAQDIFDLCRKHGKPAFFKGPGEWGVAVGAEWPAKAMVWVHTSYRGDGEYIVSSPPYIDPHQYTPMRRYGKKTLGRTLNGVEYNETPWRVGKKI
jgi:protein gp37